MSAHNTPYHMYQGPLLVDDPGDTGTIVIDRYGAVVPIVSNGTEARTLKPPTKAGILATICLDEELNAGFVELTVTDGYNFDGDTSIVFGDDGDYVTFMSVKIGSNYRWRVVGEEGTNVGAESGSFDTLTATTATIVTVAHGSTDLNEHGAGAIGTGVAPSTNRYTRDSIIITDIAIDLTGLASVATANDVIGLAAGGNAYIGQNVVATNGVIFKMELICLETPATGDNDVNVVVNSSGTLAYDGAGGTTYGVNAGDGVAGQVVENLVQGLTANHYFYLTAGTGDTAATYTAGQYILRLHGHALLA